MPDPVVIVDKQGVEHEFPPGFDPKRAADIVRRRNADTYRGPDTYLGGVLQSVQDTARETGRGVMTGIGQAFYPTRIPDMLTMLSLPFNPSAQADLLRSGPAIAEGLWAMRPSMDPNPPATSISNPTTGGQVIGNLVGSELGGRAIGAVGGVVRKAAPKAMELGLQRTKAERLDFPNTAQRLVDEGIIPTRANVQNALSGVEAKINADAAAYDAAHPLGRVDPDTIAANAHAFATKEGKVPGLGNVPGAEASELDAIKSRYQAQNTRSRNLSESIDQKRAYAARSRYNSRPNAPTVTNNELNFNKGVAAENRAAAIRLNPALEADLAKEQDLLGALVAAENNAAKGMPNTLIGAAKSVAFGPRTTGYAAKVMDRTGHSLQVMSPAAWRAAIAQLIASQQAQRGE